MTQKTDNEEVDFTPGSIMLQYVNDDERFVGMVAGKHMLTALSERDHECYNLHGDDRYLVYLILGWFENYNKRWSVFSRDQDIRFPSYTIGLKKHATPADLSLEIELLCRHRTESVSRGLNSGRLNRSMFGFSPKQGEVLEIVALTRHYLSGGKAEKAFMDVSGPFLIDYGKLFGELRIAVPFEFKE